MTNRRFRQKSTKGHQMNALLPSPSSTILELSSYLTARERIQRDLVRDWLMSITINIILEANKNL